MCSRPIQKAGYTFSCRTCNECIAVRRAQWISRALAELATSKHAHVLTLTYSEETQESRDAARMFAYADVRAFIHRLNAALRRLKAPSGVRFLCAGEQGDENGRCHWHLIVYSPVDLRTLGNITRFGRTFKTVDSMLTVGKCKIRCDWSLWTHGYVTFQRADAGGFHYVLSYCLKDQFTHEKSQGTMREAKAENFATGLFRMSKRPGIGEAWLVQKMEALEAVGAVLPSLNLKVPGDSGYWHPSGGSRKKLLWYLRALYLRALWNTGRVPPQWPALLLSLKDDQPALDLLHGTLKERQDENDEHLRKSKVLAQVARDWELDTIGEEERLMAYTARETARSNLRCLCNSCVKDQFGAPRWHKANGHHFFFAANGAELAGSETVFDIWGEVAHCEACGTTTNLWAVEPRQSVDAQKAG